MKKSRLEAGYVTVYFGLMFFLMGFLGNIAANYIYDQEKNSILFGGAIIGALVGTVSFIWRLARFFEKELEKED